MLTALYDDPHQEVKRKMEEGHVRRNNDEIYEIHQAPTIAEVLKSRRMQHVRASRPNGR